VSLEILDVLVKEKVDQMPDAVFGLFLDKVRQNHICHANHHPRTNECDCNYCRTLRSYVDMKLRCHRFKRVFNREDHDIISEAYLRSSIATTERLTKEYRGMKNEAKQL
jgi:hypothetical protein